MLCPDGSHSLVGSDCDTTVWTNYATDTWLDKCEENEQCFQYRRTLSILIEEQQAVESKSLSISIKCTFQSTTSTTSLHHRQRVSDC